MEITWYGHSCFRIAERGKPAVITDPFSDEIGIPSPKVKGEVVTISHDVPGHNFVEAVKGAPMILRGSGEYEIGGVFIMGIAMHNANSPDPRPNISYLFDYDGLTVLHLGDLDHVPAQSLIEEIGEVNVLLLPVGGGMSLKAAQAAEVVSLIEPFYVVPMHYELPGLAFELEPLDKFLKAMGVSKVQESDMLKVSASDMPDQPQVVVLSAQV
ncbi:MAG: MBL fold metallo-hydrolase [Anaerolineae bacterium]|uniref:MBL fold metallo-hydrolase n=1 Tax=Candidatus Flexifilum breve TaxID=3140694 RepID=UPI001AD2B53D|nr:MBL fold metallo-hydrolase [Chloroflexota bacterium]MBN8635747.1 MBL fold metallo-hydrolase [Anaerolineae bacterium]